MGEISQDQDLSKVNFDRQDSGSVLTVETNQE
jgi:hypothetical protein